MPKLLLREKSFPKFKKHYSTYMYHLHIDVYLYPQLRKNEMNLTN